jgi:hypothetical protein
VKVGKVRSHKFQLVAQKKLESLEGALISVPYAALHAERAASEDRLSQALAGLPLSTLEIFGKLHRNGGGALSKADLEPLVKAGVLRKHPWSELGTVGNDEAGQERTVGSGLEFAFPTDSAVLYEGLPQTRPRGVKRVSIDSGLAGNGVSSSSGSHSEEIASRNGQNGVQRKSFYEV